MPATNCGTLVEALDVPAVCTLMGLGALPADHPNFISMPGMHGSYAANMGMYHADLLIALGDSLRRSRDRAACRLLRRTPKSFTWISIRRRSARTGMRICRSSAT